MDGFDDSIPVIITDKKAIAESIVAIDLGPEEGRTLDRFQAGAHIDLFTPQGPRPYSLCNNPRDVNRYRLGVLRENPSRGGSTWVHESLSVGQKTRISRPRNNFPLADHARTTVLVAGGIGITPLMAMAYRLASLNADFTLHYCVRTPSRAAFLDDLAVFRSRVVPHFDDGPVAQTFSLDLLPPPGLSTHLYVCGPTAFMERVLSGAEARGWPGDALHAEYFSANVEKSGASFTVKAARSGITVEIPVGRTIAEALYSHGVHVPLSCEQGICGTCLTRVLEGVPDHRDLYQTDDEKAANTHITPCCSRARSPVLVLDL